MSAHHRRTTGRGQALAEIALVLPIICLLLLGIYSISILVQVQNAATNATRNGARLGSELGNGGYRAGTGMSTDPTIVDGKIVSTVLAGMRPPNAPSGITVVEVDVYEPDAAQPAGYFSTTDSHMLLDRYDGNGNPYPGWSSQYTLDLRHSVLGNTSPIGVRVLYTYTSPYAMFAWLSGQRSAYTVMELQPQ